MGDRLNGIDVFVTAVESGSFSQASERLHITRSAVAKTIARLEQRLGARLFNRTTRTQSLTEDGQAFYERCGRVLAELDAAEAELESGKHEPTGLLRISMPVMFGRYCVAPGLLELSKVHPKLNIEMSFNDRYIDLVNDGYDLAVRLGSMPDSATLAARLIGVQGMSICASPAYIAQHGRPKNIADLYQHAGIVYSRSGMQIPWKMGDDQGQIQNIMMPARLRFDDLQAIADATVAGMGLAWLPCWLVTHYLQRGELEIVFNATQVAPTDVYVVWPKTKYLTAKTRLVIDTLVEETPQRMSQTCVFNTKNQTKTSSFSKPRSIQELVNLKKSQTEITE